MSEPPPPNRREPPEPQSISLATPLNLYDAFDMASVNEASKERRLLGTEAYHDRTETLPTGLSIVKHRLHLNNASQNAYWKNARWMYQTIHTYN